MKSLFLVFCGFVLLSSCNSGKKIENDLEKENLKGDVIFTITEGDGQTAMCFDDNGMKTRDIKFNKVSGSFTDVAYFYQNSKLTQSIIKDFSESSLKQTISKFKYDNSGFLISEESDENLRSLKYDSYGLLIEENIRFSANRYYQKTKTNSYYSNKMLDSTIIIETPLVGQPHIIKKYYEKGSLKSQSTTLDGIKFYNENFTYNRNGDMIMNSQKFDDWEMKVAKRELKYEYNYDSKGNWTEKRELTGFDYSLKRTIIYKGGDYSSLIGKLEILLFSLSNHSGSNSNLNNSNYGNNNSSSNQQNYGNQQNNQQSQRKCSYCNGTGRCKTCGRTFKVEYWDDTYHWTSRNESRPGLVMCPTCRGSGVIYGLKSVADARPPSKSCNVCGGRGWTTCPDCNYSGNGRNIGQCSHCNGTGISR